MTQDQHSVITQLVQLGLQKLAEIAQQGLRDAAPAVTPDAPPDPAPQDAP